MYHNPAMYYLKSRALHNKVTESRRKKTQFDTLYKQQWSHNFTEKQGQRKLTNLGVIKKLGHLYLQKICKSNIPVGKKIANRSINIIESRETKLC